MPDPTNKLPVVDYSAYLNTGGNGVLGGAPTGEDYRDFSFQPKAGADNYLLRAQNQGFAKQLGLTLANGAANFVTGMGEMVGFGGALVSEWGKDSKDYSNALTQKMQEWHNPFGEVYRKNPNALVDMGDSAWWLNTLGDLVVSAATFALPGAGLGIAFSKAAEAAALALDGVKAAKLGLTTGRLLSGANKIAQVATAATLAYAEGAQMGYSVYDKSFKAQYDKGIREGKSIEEATQNAREIASNAAATTVQLNTIMNTGLNMIQLMPFFHDSDNAVKKFLRTEGRMAEGETAAAYSARMKAFAGGDGARKALASEYRASTVLGTLALEGGSEGLEELNNNFAEKTGYAQGKAGAKSGMISQLKELSQWADRTMDEEGALSFALGAIGGMAQGVLIDRLPIHRITAKDAAGNPILKTTSGENPDFIRDPKTGAYKTEKKWVTGITRKYNGEIERFNDVAESLAADANWFDTKQKELQQAVAINDYAAASTIRNQMMDVTNMNSVSMGRGKNVRAMYEQLGQVDNTIDVGAQMMEQINKDRAEASNIADPAEQQAAMAELDAREAEAQSKLGKTYAMINGLTTSTEDNTYKERAHDALERIDAIQHAYDHVEEFYGAEESDKVTGVKDYAFRTLATQSLLALNLKHTSRDLEKARIEFNKSNPANVHRDAFDVANIEFNNRDKNLRSTFQTLVADNANINVLASRIQQGTASEADVNQFKSLMQKYASVVTGSVKSDVAQTAAAIKAEADRLNREIKENEEVMLNSVGYTEWVAQNPGKTVADYQQKLSDTFFRNDHIDSLEKHVEETKAQLNITNEQVAELKKSKFSKVRKKLLDGIAADKAAAEAANTEALKNASGNTLAARAQAAVDANKRDASIAEADKNITRLQGEITELAKEFAQLKAFKWSAQSIKDRFADSTRHRMRDLAIQMATKRAEIENWSALKAAVTATPVPTVVIPDADTEPVIESPEEVEPETPAPNPLSEEEQTELVQKWFDEVSNNNMFLTTDELETLLRGYVGDRMSDEDIRAIVVANLPYLNDIEKLPTDYASNLYSFVVNNFPQAQQAPLLEELTRFLVSMEENHPKMPSDAELVETIMTAIPTLDRENVRFVANLARALADSMQKEMMTFEELMVNADLIKVQQQTNDIYDVAPTSELPVAAEGPTPLPTEGDNSQPDDSSFTQEQAVTQQKDTHFGLKSLDANSVATTTLQYTEDKIPQADGSVKHIFINKRDAQGNLMINPDVNTDILFPNYITKGDKIVLKVELDNTTKLNPDGSIAATEIGNFNIVIYGPDGRKIGNVHTSDWATASNIAGANDDEQFRNIAGGITEVQKAQTQLLEFRSYIADQYKKNKGQVEFHTVVTSKGPGMTNLHTVQEKAGAPKKIVPWLASKALPDTSLRLGLVLNSMIKTDWEVQQSADTIGIDANNAAKLNGYPLVLLPAADGSFTYGILERSRLAEDENSPVYQTAIRAIQLYLEQDINSDEVKQIKAATGHDITTVQGLKAYFQEQITETTIINKLDLTGNGNGKFMLQIDTQGVAIGKHGGGKSAERVSIFKQVTDNFKLKLLEMFKQRFSVISIAHRKLGTRGINSPGKFSRTTYNPSTGKWTVVSFDNYNAYVKSITNTIVDGTAKTTDGRYTYTSNPRIDFDTLGNLVAKKPAEQPVVTPVPNPIDDGQALNDMLGFGIDVTNLEALPKSNALKPDSYNATLPLNRATLERMSNSLPISSRNQKTVDDVLRERVSLGHTFIVEGDNPFRRCS